MLRSMAACVCVIAALAVPSVAMATRDGFIPRHVPNASEIGHGKLHFLFWRVFEATLHAPNGQWRADAPFSLTLRYFLDLKGRDIAKRSVQEIKGQGFDDTEKLGQWEKDMTRIFPDISPGETLTGIRNASGETYFYHNGKFIGKIKDRRFTERFFNIWLGEKTSQPDLRKKLLGYK